MNKGLFKKYWSYYHNDILAIAILLVVIGTFICDFFFGTYFWVLFFMLSVRDYFRRNATHEEIGRLKAKGLTQEDAENIRFVKKWEQTRAEGKWSYCLFDGGIIQGGILALFLCLVAMKVIGMQVLFAEVSGMFLLIGGAYLSGGIIASIIYVFLWKCNERRFKRLTQFGHLIS